MAASDRFYFVEDLLPIHPNCECTVLPVITGQPDPKLLNPTSYEAVAEVSDAFKEAHEQGPKTTKVDLSNVRIRIENHSELGAMLVYEKGSLHVRRLVPAAQAA